MFVLIRQFNFRTNETKDDGIMQVRGAESGVDDRGLMTQIGTDEEDRIGLIDAGNSRVKDVVRANVDAECGRGGAKGLIERQRFGAESAIER